MSLCRSDRAILDLWVEHGIPDDPGSRAFALGLLLKLWASHKELDAALGEALALDQPAINAEPQDGGAPSSQTSSGPNSFKDAAEETIPDLMAALAESVTEANAARARHVARPACKACGYRDGHESGCPDDPRSWANG